MKPTKFNYYTVKFTLKNDVVSKGERHQSEITNRIDIFAENKKKAIQKAVATIPYQLDSNLVKTSITCTLVLDGSCNHQLQKMFV